jgi:hypothetical protein
MSAYEWFLAADNADVQALLASLNVTVQETAATLIAKQPPTLKSSKLFVLNTANQTTVGGTPPQTPTFNSPSFSLGQAITCSASEYIQLNLLRFNTFVGWADFPTASITFTTGTVATTVSIPGGKYTNGNLAVAVQNSYILTHPAFTVKWSYSLNTFTFTFSTAHTITVSDASMQRSLGLAASSTTTNNVFVGAQGRPQIHNNINLKITGLTPLSGQSVLASMPVLAGQYTIMNWRPYIANEASMRITENTVSELSYELRDAKTNALVDCDESEIAIEVNVYRV